MAIYYTPKKARDNIVRQLLLVPITLEQAKKAAGDILRKPKSMAIFQSSKISGDIYDFKGKVDRLASLFPEFPDFRARYVKAALSQASLFYQSPYTGKANIDGVVERFADKGLTAGIYLEKCAFRHPMLFCQSSETINGHMGFILKMFESGLFKSANPINDIMTFPMALSYGHRNLRIHKWFAMIRGEKDSYSHVFRTPKRVITDKYREMFPGNRRSSETRAAREQRKSAARSRA